MSISEGHVRRWRSRSMPSSRSRKEPRRDRARTRPTAAHSPTPGHSEPRAPRSDHSARDQEFGALMVFFDHNSCAKARDADWSPPMSLKDALAWLWHLWIANPKPPAVSQMQEKLLRVARLEREHHDQLMTLLRED